MNIFLDQMYYYGAQLFLINVIILDHFAWFSILVSRIYSYPSAKTKPMPEFHSPYLSLTHSSSSTPSKDSCGSGSSMFPNLATMALSSWVTRELVKYATDDWHGRCKTNSGKTSHEVVDEHYTYSRNTIVLSFSLSSPPLSSVHQSSPPGKKTRACIF